MFDLNFVILYVKNPVNSAKFYTDLFAKQPVESSDGFVMYALNSGIKLGLWATHTVEPVATAVGGAEMAFPVDSVGTVTALHETWQAKGLTIAQEPTHMDFGFTFVALDPDGHRLRVFAPNMA